MTKKSVSPRIVSEQVLFPEARTPLPLWVLLVIPIVTLAVLIASASIFGAVFPTKDNLVGLLQMVFPLIVIFGVYIGFGRLSLLTQSPNRRPSAWVWGIVFIVVAPLGWWFHITDLASGKTAANSATAVIVFTLTMIGVGFFEEMTFRGFLFGGLLHRGIARTSYPVAVWTAAIVSSIIFGPLHVINYLFVHAPAHVVVSQMVYATLLGIFLSALYYRGHSLWWVAVVHGAFDFLTQFGDITHATTGATAPAQQATPMESLTTVLLLLPWAIIGAVMIHRDIKRRLAHS